MFLYRWSVPKAGFRWLKCRLEHQKPLDRTKADEMLKELPDWSLVRCDEPSSRGRPYEVNRFDLLDVPALFHEFAQLAPGDKDEILAFANRYGELEVKRVKGYYEKSDKGLAVCEYGEPFETWREEILDMKEAVGLWDMVQEGQVAALRNLLTWHEASEGDSGKKLEAGWVYNYSGERKGWMIVGPLNEANEKGDVLRAALFTLRRWVDDKIKSRVSTRFLFDRKEWPRFQIVPDGLLGALWLQLGRVIDGKKVQPACRYCHKRFEIKFREDGRKAKQVFCDGGKCKSADYRDRKEKARRMFDEGKPLKQIAIELKTKESTIKQWAKKRKGR